MQLTMNGGNVIPNVDYLICGVTQRINIADIQQLKDALDMHVVAEPNIVHFKRYVDHLERGRFIGIEKYSNYGPCEKDDFLLIPDNEAYAANTLTINRTVIIPHVYPETVNILKQSSFNLNQLHVSEFAHCEGR